MTALMLLLSLFAQNLPLSDASPSYARLEPPLPQMPIEVILHPPPPGKLFIQDLWRIELINTSAEAFEVYMHLQVERQGQGLIMEATSSVFAVPPGVTVVADADISPIETTFYDPEYEDILMQSGSFPSGDYNILIQVFDAGGELLGEGGFFGESTNISPPKPLAPADGSAVSGQSPVFTWLPAAPELPSGWSYRLTVTDLLEGQSPEGAVASNPPRITRETASTMLAWPEDASLPEDGTRYAWRLELLSLEGSSYATGETWSFTYSSETAPEEPGTTVWTSGAGAAITTGLVVDRSLTAVVGAADGSVRSVGPQGSQGWMWRGPGRMEQVSVAGPTILAMGACGAVALDASGAPLWSLEDRGRCVGGSVDDTLAVLAFACGTVAGVDTEDGSVLWEVELDGAPLLPPCISAEGLAGVCSGSELLSLEPGSGEVSRRWSLDSHPTAPPSAASGGGWIVPLAETVELVGSSRDWSAAPGASVRQEVVTGPGDVLAVATEGMNLALLDAATGGTLRRLRVGVPLSAPPSFGSDGRIYVSCGDGTVRCFDQLGRREWTAEVGSVAVTSPRVSPDGTVLVATMDGSVAKITCASTAPAASVWPSEGGGSRGERRAM